MVVKSMKYMPIKWTRRINITLEEIEDEKISIALMASFVILTIQYSILIYFNLLETTNALKVQLISKVLVGVIFLYALPAVLKRSKIKFIGTYCIGLIIVLLNYLIFPENHLYLNELIFPFFFMCLPTFIYSLSLKNWYILKQTMKKASLIVFLFGTILGMLILGGKASAGAYSMSLSYYMLLPTIMYLDELLDKLSLKAFLYALVSLLIILALGSRGAILCSVVFVVLKLIKFDFKQKYSSMLYYLLTMAISVVMYIYLDHILEITYNLLLNFGIRSRSILLFLRKDTYLSGRDTIYQKISEEISNNPFLGIGLGGDRRIIGGGYAHNFFLEVLANFGIFMGLILSFALILLILRLLLVKDKEKYNMLIIWLSLGFVHLMVSSSYLIDIKFWILMGFITNILRNGKYQRSQMKYP